ncbi:hypothetical protein [Brevibacillus choshinensis]|uniref:Uncharacterized protein n=1 Tax=Brevibacillus choshinensis TaxID=54911 RepID=A0ABX7FIC0_BRECH|nr:hypothetical protein [Brevibacillus choshinensis]QRG65831.1 hypothetical protein JNE38_19835 [Brevibacillus choshinensis]
MKKWVVSALLVCLATGSLLSGLSVSPAMGATTPMKRNSQVSQPVHKPIHDMVVFNDYQVVGLTAGGWNWVKNDEFILPPDTPLDVDLTQTTYGSGTNVNRHEVFLDGVELTALGGETKSTQATLKWQVPRFSIPSSQLSAGQHTMTLVVTDAKGQKSTVNVRFQVEAQNYPYIYEGEKAIGASVPSGSTSAIFGLFGSRSFSSKVPGTWRLTNKATNTEMRSVSGLVFTSGSLKTGQYDLVFTPDDSSQSPWMTTIQVGLAEIYMGTDATGQKLTQNQVITAEKAPSTVKLFSPFAGRWWVNGTGQTLTNSQSIEVAIPEMLAGMTISVTFEPNQPADTTTAWMDTSTTLQIQVPGTPEACGPSTATATMDVLMQRNEKSSLMLERSNLYSSDVTVKLYQNPVHLIWLTTAADHVEFGSEADDDEGPGVWAVDNKVVDAAKLNWDHTALALSSFKPGRYKVNYYSKREPRQSWCGYVQVIEDVPPISSSPVCDPGDVGTVPYPTPMRFVTKSGKEYRDGDRIVVDSQSDLNDLKELVLMSTHVAYQGTKRIILNKSSKTERSYVHVPDLIWEDGETLLGSKQEYGSGTIESSNVVKIKYNDDTLMTIKPRHTDQEEDKSDTDGVKSLDFKKFIDFQDGKPGVYTIEVTNVMGYRTCEVVYSSKDYTKNTDMLEKQQSMTITIEVQ